MDARHDAEMKEDISCDFRIFFTTFTVLLSMSVEDSVRLGSTNATPMEMRRENTIKLVSSTE